MEYMINDYLVFKSWYEKILKAFQFDMKEDIRARDVLLEIVNEKGMQWEAKEILYRFKTRLNERDIIIVYGCGPSLEQSVQKIIAMKGRNIFKECINLAADGASVFLKRRKIPIDAIFTDLDGITKAEFSYGDFIVVHGHGDNIDKLKSFKNQIMKKENIITTTQVEPENGVFNPGGFTDGDRILYFIKTLLSPDQSIFLIGMDFKDIVGKFSKLNRSGDFTAPPIKRKKLRFAVELLEDLVERMENEVYFVNSPRVSDRFQYLSLPTFLKEHL